MRKKKYFALIILSLLFTGNLTAQSDRSRDTVALTLTGAESLFLQNNFQLLAGKYDVSASEAAIIQAKLYPNPNLSIDQGAYNQDNKRWFNLSSSGETAISLQQMILLAGKRNKQVNIAKIGSQISTYQFYDLVRTLRYTLRSSFYALFFLREQVTVYDREIESLITLIDAYTAQYKKGNIAFKELARLQALQFGLQNERMELVRSADENQHTLILLTGDTLLRPVKPLPDTDFINRIDVSKINYLQLVDSGMSNRYDLRAANTQVQLNQGNLSLQKALRVPDLRLGLNYDKNGSYVANYNSVSVAIDLPFWNRNQGNIKMAEYQIKESQQLQSEALLQVKNDISKAYTQLLETDKLYTTALPQFNTDYDKLLDGIIKGYANRTISLLEFIDYYETYKNSKIEFNHLQNNRLEALENLNLATGTIILK
jgi:cobalt-zinc-cadmium efflux system outer membrane protein